MVAVGFATFPQATCSESEGYEAPHLLQAQGTLRLTRIRQHSIVIWASFLFFVSVSFFPNGNPLSNNKYEFT